MALTKKYRKCSEPRESVEQRGFAGYNQGPHIPVLAIDGDTVTIRTAAGARLTVSVLGGDFEIGVHDHVATVYDADNPGGQVHAAGVATDMISLHR